MSRAGRAALVALGVALSACSPSEPGDAVAADGPTSDVAEGSSDAAVSPVDGVAGDDVADDTVAADADGDDSAEDAAGSDATAGDAAADGAVGDDAGPGDATADAFDAGPSGDERFGPVPPVDSGTQTVDEPFVGVRIVSREASEPRPLRYHVVQIDPQADGLHFRLTPQNGDDPRETTRQTTQAYLADAGAQLAINAHFFSPWPPEDAWADVIGWAVSDGDAYSPFQSGWRVALALGASGEAAIVEPNPDDASGLTSTATFVVDDAVGASERILTAGEVTATWDELHPRTAVGVDDDGDVVFMVVDGRQDGVSEGMTTGEVAEVMATFDVVDAINLDGGGSTTLVVADPDPRLVNTPVGYVLPNSERDNGSNLAVFARAR